MTCGHCRRELAGVAMIFPETPPVCGRADCLAWARPLPNAARIETPGGGSEKVIDLDEDRAAA
jgi:hypothetical protein